MRKLVAAVRCFFGGRKHRVTYAHGLYSGIEIDYSNTDFTASEIYDDLCEIKTQQKLLPDYNLKTYELCPSNMTVAAEMYAKTRDS